MIVVFTHYITTNRQWKFMHRFQPLVYFPTGSKYTAINELGSWPKFAVESANKTERVVIMWYGSVKYDVVLKITKIFSSMKGEERVDEVASNTKVGVF